MASRPEVTGRRYLKKRAVAARYGKSSTKTVDRWIASGILSGPDFVINGIGFWDEERLDERDRARTVAAGTSRTKRLLKDQPANSPTP